MRNLTISECTVISGGGYISYEDIHLVSGLLSEPSPVLLGILSIAIVGVIVLTAMSYSS